MVKMFRTSIMQLLKNKLDFLKFFCYFTLVTTVVASLLGMVLYMRSSRMLEKETEEANQNMLIQLIKSTDVVLNEVDKSLIQIVMDSAIIDFMEYYKAGDYLMQYKIKENLFNILSLNKYISSMYIYYSEENKIMSLQYGVEEFDRFDDKDVIERINKGNIGFGTMETRQVFNKTKNTSESMITMIKPVPAFYIKPRAYLIVNIEKSYLKDIIDSINAKEEAKILLFNQDGNILHYSGDIEGISSGEIPEYMSNAVKANEGNYSAYANDEKLLISFQASPTYGWKYIYMLPHKTIAEKIKFIKKDTMFLTLIIVLFGLAVSYFFSNKIYKPIQSLANLFIKNETSKNDYNMVTYIKRNVNNIIEQNKNMEELLADQKPVLINSFINSILSRYIDSESEIEDKLKYYEIDFGGLSHYIVYIISIDDFKNYFVKYTEREKNILLVYLKNITKAALNENQVKEIVIDGNPGEIIVIINLQINSSTMTDIGKASIELGKKLHKAVIDNIQYSASVGIGRVYESLDRIADSYLDAVQALQYRLIVGRNKILPYEEIQSMKDKNYSYPFELENEILSALKKGDIALAKAHFNGILKRILNKNEISPPVQTHYVFVQLLCSIVRCIHEIGWQTESIFERNNIFEDLLKCSTNDEFSAWFNELFTKAGQYIEGRKDSKNQDIINSLEEYIVQNYGKDLSLNNLSQQFFFSGPYLCKIFKEQTNRSIKEFITEVRMEKAKELLVDPGCKISDVADKVGYDKIQAFIKVFKNYTGMTAGEYRASLAIERSQHDNKDI